MFKRVVWMGLGATAGAGASLWATQRVRRAVAGLAPDHLAIEAAGRLRRARHHVRAALAEGRQAMAAREAELRAQLPTSTARPVLEPAGRDAIRLASRDTARSARPVTQANTRRATHARH